LGLQSEKAIRFLSGLGLALPSEIEQRIVWVQPAVSIRCWLEIKGLEERLCVAVVAGMEPHGEKSYTGRGWENFDAPTVENSVIVTTDTRLMRKIPGLLTSLGLRDYRDSSDCWVRVIGKRFPEEFIAWIEEVPPDIELLLEGDLDSLRTDAVKGTLELSVEENTPDWFDVRVALSVSDTQLTSDEIQMLMEARGKFVRLNGKGWRRLDFEFEGDDEAMLNDLGINSIELDGPPQRYHVLQLAHSSANRLLEKSAREAVLQRAGELQVAVHPPIPSGVNAKMRPYQIEGYHFLCYLSTNRFGGILADDMGLGKTLQTLTWIQWLRERDDFDGKCTLVVCPKSVVQNWVREAERFVPGMRASAWKGGDLRSLRKCIDQSDLVVVNYAQLRILANLLTAIHWHAIVLDEAQYIKNPASQTAVAACALAGNYRLALSGTPIENRLMDLWSIMQFAMPGLLGLRSHFQKRFDSRTDGFARQRLSSRVRPFILRRSKSEVAKDLPERIEEDLLVEMEGSQELLYRAELKRARQAILKIETSKELDKQRFNVLTSLLRLRQICCHPGLVSEDHGHADSAKLDALTDLLEPLMEEGHKVLVFSQFVEMLERVEREVDARGWDSFMLTGETENRGELVDEFQAHEGSAVFLISLRAGGMGLNLTAASYVVLFDPWWNPAVENQAIDRTHRIGQTHQVIAYRLVVKNSIEEKIRHLQRTKSAMASDVLGEESFAKALTLSDFQFLMED
jgi:SNF2 family DNA or RNA helicase